jgi:hypothetical protein
MNRISTLLVLCFTLVNLNAFAEEQTSLRGADAGEFAQALTAAQFASHLADGMETISVSELSCLGSSSGNDSCQAESAEGSATITFTPKIAQTENFDSSSDFTPMLTLMQDADLIQGGSSEAGIVTVYTFLIKNVSCVLSTTDVALDVCNFSYVY